MTDRHLRVFVEVYKNMSVTRAAGVLNMTQPAVTRTVREMENYYGVELFDRLNHRLYPTAAGNALYSKALHIIESLDSVEKELRERGSSGILRIGSTVTLACCYLPELMEKFTAEYPETELHVSVMNGESLCEMLLDNRLDIALIENRVEHPKLSSEPIGGDELVPVLPAGHPLTKKKQVSPTDIAEYPLLLREKGSTVRSAADAFFALHGLEPVPLMESVSTGAILAAVRRGIGISLLPRRLVQDDVESGRVTALELSPNGVSREHFAVYHKDKFLSEPMKSFIAMCGHTV